MIATTTNCKRYGHLEFAISFDPDLVIRPDVDWLLGCIETAVATGQRFQDGETYQVGWMLTFISRNASDTLSILEPVPSVFPVRLQESVSLALIHFRLHKDVAESVGLLDLISFPSYTLECVACTHYGSSGGLILDRLPLTRPTDSGWFLGCDDEAHDHQNTSNLRRLSLWEATCKDGRSIPYLALPPRVLVHLGPPVPQITFNERQLPIARNSYLHRKYLASPNLGA